MSAVQRVRSEASPTMSLEAAARRRSMSSARACRPRARPPNLSRGCGDSAQLPVPAHMY
jgi:hypothetical protein